MMAERHSVLPRVAERSMNLAMRTVPVVVVSGARQTGKTTLVRSAAATQEHLYLSLDDLDVREQARDAPDDLVRRAPRLIIDEVQREPELLLAIKRCIDAQRPREPGRFVLTGSANLLLASRVSESLAGRAAYVNLWPLTRRELRGEGRAGAWSVLLDEPVDSWRDAVEAHRADRADWHALARVGGYPTPAHELEETILARPWFDGYVRTYLERDLQDLASISNLVDFRRLMRAACHRLGNLLNQAELARDVGLSHATAHRYLNLLEASYQLVRLQPYAVNRTKRLTKSPKVYWADTGLALHLSGADPSGAHLENMLLADLMVWRDAWEGPGGAPEILYWRTHAGQEVDFVVEHRERLVGIEVKSSRRPRGKDLKGLRAFRDEYPDRVAGTVVLHTGEEVSWLADGVLGAPWWCFA